MTPRERADKVNKTYASISEKLNRLGCALNMQESVIDSKEPIVRQIVNKIYTSISEKLKRVGALVKTTQHRRTNDTDRES